MFYDDFNMSYGEKYSHDVIDYDESTYRIEIEEELFPVIIDVDGDKCDVYIEITFEEYDSYFLSQEKALMELLILQNLPTDPKPSVCFEDGMGCPFFAEQIGYYNLALDLTQVVSQVEILLAAINNGTAKSEESLVIDFLQEHYPKEYKSYQDDKERTLKYITDVLGADYKQITHSDLRIKTKEFSSSDPIFINKQHTSFVGFSDKAYQKTKSASNIDVVCKVVKFYKGFKFTIGEADGVNICADTRLVNDFLNILEDSDLEFENDIYYFTDKKSSLHIKCGNLWAIIFLIRIEKDRCVAHEKMELAQRLNELRCLEPTIKGYIDDTIEIDFNKITPEQFEKMCCDFLIQLGFKKVTQRGKTNAADGGVDIEAIEEVKTAFGVEMRKWLFQCKRTHKQVDRKDISEIRDLLEEKGADSFGLFYTGVFTPQTLDRINTLSKKHPSIQGWDKGRLEHEMSMYPQIITKYFF